MFLEIKVGDTSRKEVNSIRGKEEEKKEG